MSASLAVLSLGVLLLGAVCPVAHAQTGEWEWMDGPNTISNPGVYGTLHSAGSLNVPGGRARGAKWTDSNDNLWLFGGIGYDANGNEGILNDFWEFNPATNEWTWMGGSSTGGGASDVPGVYGYKGTPNSGNIPGGREYAVSWTDHSGNLWLFGGYGYDINGTAGWLNDFWEYNVTLKEWVWQGGSNTVDQYGTYGLITKGASGNIPGGRVSAMSWVDSKGNFWLFGGYGLASDNYGNLNDLWEYNVTSKQWIWMGGSSTVGCYNCGLAGAYVSEGSFVSGNVPGSRWEGMTWTDKSGNLWLFGGDGFDTNGNQGYLNDLWEYSPTQAEWNWVGGSSTNGQSGTFSTQGIPASGNVPGSRYDGSSWTDDKGNLWLFGGYGLDVNSKQGYLGDLWMFSTSLNEWTYIGGNSTVNHAGVYGTILTASPTSLPGTRYHSTNWTDSLGNFWIFGGNGLDANGRPGYLNDLWEYPPPTLPVQITIMLTLTNTGTEYQAVVTVTNSGIQPATNVQLSTATLGTGTGSPLPQNLGTLAPEGGSVTVTFTFPLSSGSPGTTVAGKFAGTYTGGTFASNIRTQLLPYPVAAAPIFSPPAGGYIGAQTVTISDTTPSSSIYYTTNGTTPTTNSTPYTGPVLVPATETLSAIASAPGYTANTSSALYTIYEPSMLTTPSPGTQLPSTTVTFDWATGIGIRFYTLLVGTNGVGSDNLYNSGAVTTTSAMVSGLPSNGATVYVRLYWYINGIWQSADYTYTGSGGPTPAYLSTPTPGSTLSGTTVNFMWNPGNTATLFDFFVGTNGIGTSNIYNSGDTSATSADVSGLPSNGETVYVRLYWLINGTWGVQDYTYKASGGPTPASLTTPTPGSTLSGTTVNFMWDPGNTAKLFIFYVGTNGVGTNNIYNSGDTSATSANVSGLPSNGETVYVRLYWLINGTWSVQDYTYKAYTAG